MVDSSSVTAAADPQCWAGQQIREADALQDTSNRTPCDLVLSATPIDLSSVLSVNKPILRVRYEYDDYGPPLLEDVLLRRLSKLDHA